MARHNGFDIFGQGGDVGGNYLVEIQADGLGPDKCVLGIKHGRTMSASDNRAAMSVNHSFARRACALILRGGTRHVLAETTMTVAANRQCQCFPHGAMARAARCKRMSNLVKNRIPDFLLVVQLDQVF
jgi:hypothetical protein